MIPNQIKTSLSLVSPVSTTYSASIIANTTGIESVFGEMIEDFERLWKRKAFFHWYKSHGMEEDDFNAAAENVRNLISEYHDISSLSPFESEEDDIQ